MHKCAAMEGDVLDVRTSAVDLTRKMGQIKRAQAVTQNHSQMVEDFRKDLSRWDLERQTNERKLVEEINHLKQEINSLKYSLERQSTTVDSHRRILDRNNDEIKQLHSTLNETRKDQTANQASVQSIVHKLRTELEVNMMELENNLIRMGDDMWGGEAGFSRMHAEVTLLRDHVDGLEGDIADLKATRATSLSV